MLDLRFPLLSGLGFGLDLTFFNVVLIVVGQSVAADAYLITRGNGI